MADVAPIVHALEMDFAHGFVGPASAASSESAVAVTASTRPPLVR